MEFHEKLQQLRKVKGLTQEELASLLFVSRTAISKWESGRGYPNIESLKAIGKLFEVSIDDLLSGDELLIVAEADSKETKNRFANIVLGLLDISVLIFLFLPLFGQKYNGQIQAVSLLALTNVPPYLKLVFWAIIVSSFAFGIVIFALQNCQNSAWIRWKSCLSVVLTLAGTLLFFVGNQIYAGVALFGLLVFKVMILIRK